MKKYHIAGAVFTLIAGTLLHFTYDWSGQNAFVGLFSAVNESTWEHLKLLAFPVMIFAVFECYAYGRQKQNFYPAKAASVLTGMAVIVTLFYTYTGIIGTNFLALDIAVFIAGVLAAYSMSYKILKGNRLSSASAKAAACFVFIALIVCFAVFTSYPPQIGLFRDPVSGGYGRDILFIG